MVKQLKLLAMAGLLAYGHCLPHSALKELCDNKMLEFDYKIVQQVEDITKYFQTFPHYEKMTQELEGCVLSGSSGTLGFYGQMMTDYYREQLRAQHSQEIVELMEKNQKELEAEVIELCNQSLELIICAYKEFSISFDEHALKQEHLAITKASGFLAATFFFRTMFLRKATVFGSFGMAGGIFSASMLMFEAVTALNKVKDKILGIDDY